MIFDLATAILSPVLSGAAGTSSRTPQVVPGSVRDDMEGAAAR
jgi:hypothetical protein